MRTLALILLSVFSSSHAANLARNPSFEAGAGQGWLHEISTNQLKVMITNGDAFHGGSSMAIRDVDGSVYASPMFLTDGVEYTFSWYEKANEANSFHYEIFNMTDGPGFGTGGFVTTPTSWTRRDIQFTPDEDGYYVVGWYHLQSTMRVLVDALQVEVGASETTFAPPSTVELGIQTEAYRNVFFAGETAQAKLILANHGGSTTNLVLSYEIFDWLNRRASTGTISATFAVGRTTNTISIPAIGYARIVTRIMSVNNSRDELTVAVIPAVRESGVNIAGIFGTHTQPDPSQQALLRGMGFTWTRTLSPSTAFRWIVREPTDDNYVWDDAQVFALTNGGMAVIGTIHSGLDFTGGPAFAHVGGDRDGEMLMPKWRDFCSNVVNRYKGVVTHWEIWNEPQQSGTPWIQVAGNYAIMLTNGIDAIKSADPTAKIIAMAGAFDEEWAEDVWGALPAAFQAKVDYVACHLYPNDNSADPNTADYDTRHDEWRAKNIGGLPIYNTETGTWSRGGHLTEVAPWAFGWEDGWEEWQRSEANVRGQQVSVDRITRNLFRSLGPTAASSKHIYYDSREWTYQAVTATQPYSWEHTKTPRPTIIALSVASSFVDGYSAMQRVIHPSAAALEMRVFTVGSTNVAVVFNYDRLIRDITTSETGFEVFDAFGSPVTQPSGKLRITRSVQYVRSGTLSVAQMTNVLVSSVATVADTTAPNISVDYAPSGTWTGGVATFKFSAIDDKYVNSSEAKTNLLWSWKMDNATYPPFAITNFVKVSLASGPHTLWLKVKDKDNNISSEFSYSLDGQSTAPKTLNVTTRINVRVVR